MAEMPPLLSESPSELCSASFKQVALLSVHVGWWEGGWVSPSLWRLCCLLTLIWPQTGRGCYCRPGYGQSLLESLGSVLPNRQGSLLGAGKPGLGP